MMRSTPTFLTLTLLAATAGPGCDFHDHGDDGPGTLQPMALCASGAGTFEEVWEVDNGHGAVGALALAPSGDVALAGEDGSVKIWTIDRAGADPNGVALAPGGVSAAYGQQFGSGAVVGALWIAPAGDTLVAGDASGLVAWLAPDGGVLGSTVPGTDPVAAVAMTDDLALVASADVSFGGNLRLWQPGGALGDPLPTALWAVDAVAFLPGTHALVAAGDIYGVVAAELRDAADPAAPPQLWQGDADASIRALAAAPDGARIVAAGGSGPGGDGVLAFLDPAAFDAPAPPTCALPGHDPVGVALLPGGLVLTAGSEGTLRVWSDQGAPLLSADVPAPAGVAVDPTGTLVTLSGADGVLRLYACVE